MKKQLATILLMAFALCAMAEGPKLTFKKLEHDFGEIEKGEKVETIFEFVNEGDTDLEIKNVATSCGCTSAKMEKTVYKPGEAGKIPVTFNSQRFSGKITKRVTIDTNDTTSPKTVVTIKGTVMVDVTAKPSNLFFAKAQMGDVTTQEIKVSTAKMPKLEISDLKIEPEFLSAELKRDDDKNITIIVKADGNKFPKDKSRLNGYLTYKTNSTSMKDMRGSITINVEQPIHVNPRAVYFYASKAGKQRKMSVTLTSSEEKAFKTSDIKSDLDYISATVSKNDDKEKVLEIVLSDKAPEGKFSGKITLATDMDGQKEVVIPIRGSVIP